MSGSSRRATSPDTRCYDASQFLGGCLIQSLTGDPFQVMLDGDQVRHVERETENVLRIELESGRKMRVRVVIEDLGDEQVGLIHNHFFQPSPDFNAEDPRRSLCTFAWAARAAQCDRPIGVHYGHFNDAGGSCACPLPNSHRWYQP